LRLDELALPGEGAREPEHQRRRVNQAVGTPEVVLGALEVLGVERLLPSLPSWRAVARSVSDCARAAAGVASTRANAAETGVARRIRPSIGQSARGFQLPLLDHPHQPLIDRARGFLRER
jgi:hypothetical protein